MGGNLGYAVVIISIYLIRYIICSIKNKNGNFLLVSLFLVLGPFEITKNLTNYDSSLAYGSFGVTIAIYISFVIALFVFVALKWNKEKIRFHSKYNFITILTALTILSILNPYNVAAKASIIFAIFFGSHIALFYLFSRMLKRDEVVKGVYDGLMLLTICQLTLAICFPILNMTVVTKLFHEGSEVWASRGGGRVGAVGLFKHPGNLALFTIISSTFFLSCFLSKFRARLSLLLLGACIITVILTYSRTSYVALIVIIFSVYYIFKNSKKNIFSVANILRLIIPSALVLYWLIFLSPFSETFLKSDASSQVDNRLVHFYMAFRMFSESPIIGVGINSHLGYISQHFGIAQAFTADDFYLHNPIHNSHLIVLAETGLLGFVLWIYFLFRSIIKAKNQIARKSNVIFSCTLIGIILGYIIYGMTGWAPMSPSIFSLLIFYVYFAIIY